MLGEEKGAYEQVGREESAVRRGESEWGTEVRVISALAQTSLSSRASLPLLLSFLHALPHPWDTMWTIAFSADVLSWRPR